MGKQRAHNEDRYVILPEHAVFVVADGMGGHQAGEVASRMAATSIAGYFRRGSGEGRGGADRLRSAVRHANAKIFQRAEFSRAHRGMGTTVVAAAFTAAESVFHVANAGDSRAYRLRGGVLEQLTRDHSLLAEALLEQPELTERDLAYLPRNVITRALGIGPTVDVDLFSDPAKPGDIYLLCSDGLHGLVTDEVIASIIRHSLGLARTSGNPQPPTLQDACRRLIDEANDNGGRDNITAVLVRIEEDDEGDPETIRGANGESPPTLKSG